LTPTPHAPLQQTKHHGKESEQADENERDCNS